MHRVHKLRRCSILQIQNQKWFHRIDKQFRGSSLQMLGFHIFNRLSRHIPSPVTWNFTLEVANWWKYSWWMKREIRRQRAPSRQQLGCRIQLYCHCLRQQTWSPPCACKLPLHHQNDYFLGNQFQKWFQLQCHEPNRLLIHTRGRYDRHIDPCQRIGHRSSRIQGHQDVGDQLEAVHSVVCSLPWQHHLRWRPVIRDSRTHSRSRPIWTIVRSNWFGQNGPGNGPWIPSCEPAKNILFWTM